MRQVVFAIICLLIFVGIAQAQENPRYDLIHIRLDEEMSQHEFATTYNICWEQVHQHLRHSLGFTIPAETDLYFPPDILPCYNEAGQRLYFFNEDEPYYTDMRVFVTREGENYESLSRTVNVCIEDIRPQNDEHFLYERTDDAIATPLDSYQFAEGQELFIPDARPCFDESGRKLIYAEDGTTSVLGEGRLYRLEYSIGGLALQLNICEEAILAANRLESADSLKISPPYATIVIPENLPSCYEVYHEEDTTIEDLAAEINVCLADIRTLGIYDPEIGNHRKQFLVRHDAPPCYDEIGQLLSPPVVEPIQGGTIQVWSGETLESLSRQYNVCAADLLEANNQQAPIRDRTYIIPETLPCYDENGYKLIYSENGREAISSELPMQIAERGGYSLQNLAWEHNICVDELLLANPHLNLDDELYWGDPYWNWNWNWHFEIPLLMAKYGSEIFIPQISQPCYQEYFAADKSELWDLAQELNICIEQLSVWQYRSGEQKPYMIPYEREECYDKTEHRLAYFDELGRPLHEPIRVLLDVYIIPHSMSTYELSQQLNVCVNDLLNINPILKVKLPYQNLEVFVPETPPCYDEATGHQLIYEDTHGNLLSEPQVSENLVYQVNYGDNWKKIGNMFNVCSNRFIDYNKDFLPNVWTVNHWGIPERIARHDGIFDVGVYVRIPTDRPPCYEYGVDNWTGFRWIRYVCYDTPLDMSKDNPDAVINPDGEHCYDIEDPETVIWHEGNRYLYQYREGLYRNDFMAWCFGVSDEDIIAEADNPIVYIIPYDELLIRNPTHPCYIREDDGAETVHWVQYGETLRDIGWQYGKLPTWIAEENDLDNPDVIWGGQRLVIPEGINLWHVLKIISVACLMIVMMGVMHYLFHRRQNLAGHKKKRH